MQTTRRPCHLGVIRVGSRVQWWDGEYGLCRGRVASIYGTATVCGPIRCSAVVTDSRGGSVCRPLEALHTAPAGRWPTTDEIVALARS